MTRKYWFDLGPSLLVGLGIVASTLVAVRTREGWVLTGPLLLAFALVGADMLQSRLRGKSSRPSAAALLLVAAFFLASMIVSADPAAVRSLMPLVGAASWVALTRAETKRNRCSI